MFSSKSMNILVRRRGNGYKEDKAERKIQSEKNPFCFFLPINFLFSSTISMRLLSSYHIPSTSMGRRKPLRTNKHYKDNHASTAAVYGRLANPFKTFSQRPRTGKSCAHAVSSTFQFENAEGHIHQNIDTEDESCPDLNYIHDADAASFDDNADAAIFDNAEGHINDNTDAESFPKESCSPSRDDNVDTASFSFEFENAEGDNADAESFEKFENKAIFDDDRLQMIIGELLIHLQTKLGGEKKLKDAKQFCRTFKNFIIFSLHKNAEDWKQLALEVVIRKILFSSYPLIGEFLEQYTKHLKSGTLLNYWNFLLTSLRWFHFDCNLNNRRCKRSLSAFEDYMKRLRKAYKRAMKKERLTSNKTFEKLVEEGRLPSGGLQELLFVRL